MYMYIHIYMNIYIFIYLNICIHFFVYIYIYPCTINAFSTICHEAKVTALMPLTVVSCEYDLS